MKTDNIINLPIYRAKKTDSDEYVEGFLYQDIVCLIYSDGIKPDEYKKALEDESWYIMNNLSMTNMIDKSTLAIHFPDMLDSQGNKIFASLSKDGKGGDILYYEDDCQPYICEHSSDGTFLFEYLDNKTIKNYICRLSQEKVLFEDLKVIGIQK